MFVCKVLKIVSCIHTIKIIVTAGPAGEESEAGACTAGHPPPLPLPLQAQLQAQHVDGSLDIWSKED